MRITSRNLEKSDYPFLMEMIKSSPEWKEEECKEDDLITYLQSYSMYNGEWKMWFDEAIPIGVTYVLEWSPSNEKPWIGTILVHQSVRIKGYGRLIINEIGNELKVRGHRALFVGCPIHQNSWLLFLGKCGFEQFKVEKDETLNKEYMISVKLL